MNRELTMTWVKSLSIAVLFACLLLLASCGSAVGMASSENRVDGVLSGGSGEQPSSDSNEASTPSASADRGSMQARAPFDLEDAGLLISNDEQACEYVRECLESANKNVPPIIECLGLIEGCYRVHGYFDAPGASQTATQFWYDVGSDGSIYEITSLVAIDPDTMEPYDQRDGVSLSEFDIPSDGQYVFTLESPSLDAWVNDGCLMIVGQCDCWPFDGKYRDEAESISMHHAFPLDGADIFSDAEPEVEGLEELARFLPEKYPCSMEVVVENGEVTFVRIY